ncbi:hypothetical protein LAJ19_14910 (plasmid) [Deinococcus taeanensis]|uniref:hypothetical protein n=1 Tax=Deinococcus taeanensis TaxID=2737050 RepID=UPI001CDCBB42|nr:hypothetical protein [Deinococcus taeanensis]UBV44099.1 hypothetical protein LAJ19_14910 [Deinococcus taeanensis]
MFVYTDAQDLSLEALNAAESLAIAAFKELLRLKKGTVGRDRRPLPRELQLGSALALMFQAAVIRLAADGLLEGTLVWRAPREVPGLREAYLDLRGERVSARTSAPQEEPAPGDVRGGDLPGDLLDSGSPPAPEVIARFGVDGGSITLDGQRTDDGAGPGGTPPPPVRNDADCSSVLQGE